MSMKRDIFENNSCPFTVPDGYFDTLQDRIMSRIHAEENRQSRIIRMPLYRRMVAAAACILFIFAAASLYMYTGKQSVMNEVAAAVDEEFYRWFYEADRVSEIAESLDVMMPDNFMAYETGFSDEDESIIQFLERDNLNVAAILYFFGNEIYSYQQPMTVHF